MARPKKNAAAATKSVEQVATVPYSTVAIVHSAPGLNVRKSPTLSAPVLRVLKDGAEIVIDTKSEAPMGWIALAGGGFVMAQYIKLPQ
jgi:hypothetical protein